MLTRRWTATGWLTLAVLLCATVSIAQNNGNSNSNNNDDDAPAQTQQARPSAQEVMDDLAGPQQPDPPVVEPSRQPDIRPVTPGRPGAPGRPGSRVPTTRPNIDRAILGIAPGQDQPTLRREGEFIVSRKGRLQQAGEGGAALFVFEADGQDAGEAPMIMQPCRLLEDMEDYVARHGDRVVFIVSGQVHTYRGANYLLPTMMKLAVDQGNLRP